MSKVQSNSKKRVATRTDTASQKDLKTGRFLPGNTGFGGRPKGARSKLNEYFLRDLQALWLENGDAILKASKPDTIVKAMLAFMPRQIELTSTMEEMTDGQLAIIAEQLLAKYGADREGGTPALGTSTERTGEAREPHEVIALPSVQQAG